jgi:hypothetical protein
MGNAYIYYYKGNKNFNDFSFEIKTNSVYMTISLNRGVLNLIGYSSENKIASTLIYDASFENISIPSDVETHVGTVEALIKMLYEHRNDLCIAKNSLFCKIKGKEKNFEMVSLPLKTFI